MNTEARRKASAAFHAKREAEGLKKVTLWLSPEARARLDVLKAAHGSKDKAAEAAIMALGSAPVAKPAPVQTKKPAVPYGSLLKKR
jgi:DNA-binding TFAR19-related protein (PDSD5 family)